VTEAGRRLGWLGAGLVLLAATAGAGVKNWGLRLTGGWTSVAAGDLGAALRGRTDLIRAEGDLSAGSLRAPNAGFDLLAEVEAELCPRVGLAVGVGYLRARKSSGVEYACWILQASEQVKPVLSAVPLTATATWRLPVWGRLSARVGAGFGAYFTNIRWERDYLFQSGWISDQGAETWRASKIALGLHGSLGLEFALGRGLALIFEAGGRWARLSGLRGPWTVRGSESLSGDYYESGTKTLWRYDAAVDGRSYPLCELADGEPQPAPSSNVRPARIDLSGFSARIGVRIGL
jgi:hypothetical protein